jgi:putative transposase
VKIRYRFRFYPTPPQERVLARTFGACRFVYNWALRARTDAHHVGENVNYNASSSALTQLKKQKRTAWLNEISCVPTQQALRHLQTAFRNFFGKRTGYPSFKKKHGPQAAEYTLSAFKYDAANRNLTIAKLGLLDVHWSRTFTSTPTTATITKRSDGRYFITLVLDEPVAPLPKTGESIGIDLGINRLATLSNGEHVVNPRLSQKKARKLAKAQRVLARRKKGSHRRDRQRIKVARIQSQISDSRLDHMHKVTTDIVRRFDTICIEDLNVCGMVQNHCLARALSDASMGQFARLLEYKCDRYGKTLAKVDRFFPSSKRCHDCGHIVERLPLSVREWACPECGAVHDRDENAAQNILAEGHSDRVNAQGDRRRRGKALAKSRIGRRTANQPALSRASHVSPGSRPLQ